MDKQTRSRDEQFVYGPQIGARRTYQAKPAHRAKLKTGNLMPYDTRSSNLIGAFVVSVYDQMVQRIESEHALSPQIASALIVIGFNEGRSVDFLSGALQLSHSGCVRLVDKLEEAGFAERREGEDRRVAQLFLTSAGRQRMQAALRSRRQYLDSLLKPLNAKEVKEFSKLVSRMLFAMTTGDEHAEAMCRFCDETACPQEKCPITLACVK